MSVSVEELSILAFQESELKEEGRNSLNRQVERKSRINWINKSHWKKVCMQIFIEMNNFMSCKSRDAV